MSEKSGFFNALMVDGDYDRKYNANDYCDNLAVVISNGVLRSNGDDLKVTSSGMTPTVAPGRAWIHGHYYHLDTALSLSPIAAPVGGSRYDRIMLRLDNTIQQRKISVVYVQGTASNNPVKPETTRNNNIYDLVLADIYVTANATGITVTDTRSDSALCGWVYSVSGDNSFFTSLDNSFYSWFAERKDTLASVTLFKRYAQKITLAEAASVVGFNIPQYDPETCFVEVYVNGLFDTRHTVTNNIITFVGSLVAGTVITVNAYKSIDGTGIESISDEITALQNAVATLDVVSKYSYRCNGLNDNISLSQIAKALCEGSYTSASCTPQAVAFLEALGGNSFLSALSPSAQVTIEVVGRCGVNAAYSGSGTEVNPFTWFALSSLATDTDRKIIFDFAKCEEITLNCENNTFNHIFSGRQVNIKNVNARIYGGATGSNVQMVNCVGNGFHKVEVDDSYLEISTSGTAKISEHGTFTNCNCYITSSAGAAYCFKPKSSTFIRLFGGSYCAFTKVSSGIDSAIVHTSTSEIDAVLVAENIHCPIVARTNYTQGFLSVANAGNTIINTVVSRLTSSGQYNTITNQINKNKV